MSIEKRAGKGIVIRYGVTGVFVALAFALRGLMAPWLGESLPFIFFLGAVAVAVWFGGLGPAIAAGVIGYFLSDIFFIPPPGITLRPELRQIMLGLAYAATCALIVVFGAMARSARRRLERELREREEVERNLAAARDQLASDLARLESLREISTALVGTRDLKELLERALEAAIAITGAEKGSLQLVDPRSGALTSAASRGFPQGFLELLSHLHDERAACTEARREAQRVVVEDVVSSPLFGPPALTTIQEAGVRSIQSTPIVTRSGRVLGVLSTSSSKPGRPDERALRLLDALAREIADLVERNESEQALREADRRKDAFLAILAHELRNPLAPLCNGLEILRLSKPGDSAAAEIHEMMERQVKALTRMVDDLLEVSRITQGRIELHREPVNLSAIVQGAVETAKPLIEAGRHRLEVSLPSEALGLRADPVRLTQVLANLLNNAAKYTSEEGAIQLTARRLGQELEISVRDNGTGIDPESLPRIFELFAQVGNPLRRPQGGLGIGLSLVQSLVEMHGGRVEARSEGPGRGSEFLVRLPLEPALERLESLEKVTRPERIQANGRVVRGTFLVADDNRDSADTIATLLSSLGASVEVVYDGRSAIEALRSRRPEVALLDLGMPGIGGLEVARYVRQQTGVSGGVFLVAMTGWGQEEDRRRSKEAGFDRHLVKPVTVEALQELLSSREAGAELKEY